MVFNEHINSLSLNQIIGVFLSNIVLSLPYNINHIEVTVVVNWHNINNEFNRKY